MFVQITDKVYNCEMIIAVDTIARVDIRGNDAIIHIKGNSYFHHYVGGAEHMREFLFA